MATEEPFKFLKFHNRVSEEIITRKDVTAITRFQEEVRKKMINEIMEELNDKGQDY